MKVFIITGSIIVGSQDIRAALDKGEPVEADSNRISVNGDGNEV